MEDTLIAEFIAYLQNERRYSSLTVEAYSYDISQFGFFLANHTLPQEETDAKFPFDPSLVSADDIKRWVMAMNEAEYKASSVNRRISSLRSYFRYLCKREILDKNPTLRISSLKRERRLPEFVEKNKMEAILDEITSYKGDEHDQCRDNLIILLFFSLGMRLAELLDIRLDDFSGDRSELKLRGKGDKERIVPIIPMLIPYINRYIELRTEVANNKIAENGDKTWNIEKESLFLTCKGRQISRSAVYRIVNERLRAAGVESKSSPHVLRHTFATYMLNQGADLRSIQEILGHASLEATQIYTHNNISRLKEVYQTAHPRSKLKI